ncbi:hypothetical protein EIN_523430 [Entamoeba invadens IP1]|uniref:Uncharacterized protein n=1 Tax=Entamoeba invadens IP1 TaxID=370355 RepID=A0A0A1UEU3_ENTIV|nr:hypothetical protein EIN_523430 [Entamoeba invadens IP1]ELP92455.1 hypothetical protein EIN_523430 [Entamoeba invadens IP1]|eukprot:XP_004259226.1 hypothetical protein EIN_523430 [Entamoeba invadens IP1]
MDYLESFMGQVRDYFVSLFVGDSVTKQNTYSRMSTVPLGQSSQNISNIPTQDTEVLFGITFKTRANAITKRAQPTSFNDQNKPQINLNAPQKSFEAPQKVVSLKRKATENEEGATQTIGTAKNPIEVDNRIVDDAPMKEADATEPQANTEENKSKVNATNMSEFDKYLGNFSRSILTDEVIQKELAERSKTQIQRLHEKIEAMAKNPVTEKIKVLRKSQIKRSEQARREKFFEENKIISIDVKDFTEEKAQEKMKPVEKPQSEVKEVQETPLNTINSINTINIVNTEKPSFSLSTEPYVVGAIGVEKKEEKKEVAPPSFNFSGGFQTEEKKEEVPPASNLSDMFKTFNKKEEEKKDIPQAFNFSNVFQTGEKKEETQPASNLNDMFNGFNKKEEKKEDAPQAFNFSGAFQTEEKKEDPKQIEQNITNSFFVPQNVMGEMKSIFMGALPNNEQQNTQNNQTQQTTTMLKDTTQQTKETPITLDFGGMKVTPPAGFKISTTANAPQITVPPPTPVNTQQINPPQNETQVPTFTNNFFSTPQPEATQQQQQTLPTFNIQQNQPEKNTKKVDEAKTTNWFEAGVDFNSIDWSKCGPKIEIDPAQAGLSFFDKN